MPKQFDQHKFINSSSSKKSLKHVIKEASLDKKQIYDRQENKKSFLPHIPPTLSFLSARNQKLLSNFQHSVKKHKKSDVLMLQKLFKDIQTESLINKNNHQKKNQRYLNGQEDYQISMKDLRKLTKSTKWGSQVELNNYSQVAGGIKSSRFTNRRNNSQFCEIVTSQLQQNLKQKRFSTPNPQLLKQRVGRYQIKQTSQPIINKRLSLPIIQQSSIKTSQQLYQQRIKNLKQNYGKAMSRRDHKNMLSDQKSKQKLLDIHYFIRKKMQQNTINRQLKKQEKQFKQMMKSQQKHKLMNG